MHIHITSSRAPAGSRRPVAALIAAAACWGLGAVVSKQVVDQDVLPRVMAF